MIPLMRVHTIVPLAALLVVLAPLFCASRAQTGSPTAVVDSFFKAAEQERWRDAAQLMDLESFGALRDENVRTLRRPRTPHHATPEELMQFDPKMPRVVAEYQAARMNEQVSRNDWLMSDYADVPNADSLAALSAEEAAARWLQAKDPRYRMRRSLAAQQARCGLPDSAITALIRTPSTTARVLGVVMADSLAYVLYVDAPVASGESDSLAGRTRRHDSARRAVWIMAPSVMTLRRIGSRWRIAPGEPFGGWSDYVTVINCPPAEAGKSPPHEPR
jgi:hypothetical protein